MGTNILLEKSPRCSIYSLCIKHYLVLWFGVLPAMCLSCTERRNSNQQDYNSKVPKEENDEIAKSADKEGYTKEVGPKILALEDLLRNTGMDSAARRTASQEKLNDFIQKSSTLDQQTVLKRESSVLLEEIRSFAQGHVNELNRHLKALEEGKGLCESKLKELEDARKEEVDYSSTYTEGLTDTVTCNCTRQFCVTRALLCDLDARGAFGTGHWCNRTLPEFLQEHPNTRRWRVPTCVYCCREKAAAYVENLLERLKKAHKELSAERDLYCTTVETKFHIGLTKYACVIN